ncbi:Gfo/Idh/MocA family protein [Halomarina oriensis]|uniref:Gfo/Idh/MocA family oxidoreductase n=1 Tax=Halomarina oriensis TaxID=671145 RepID=A0A6B0GQB4_9EURY|nr:Gfo/Idh/MocA family oxidoreductase [Halomarina oriensis]MWG36261.1 gfo/Idh/MocA family oxidoreductase [Halomarina oriensis]
MGHTNETTTELIEREAVRLGLVGLGNIGRHHANQLRVIDEEEAVTLVGGMDIAAEARESFEAEFGVETYSDHHELFEAVDAVIVTTPNCFHEEYAVAALDAGLDVLVEKPLAHDLASAERIAAAARGADGFCMVGFHNRFGSPAQVLRGCLDDGRFGDVYHVEANYVRRRGVPGRGSWFTSHAVAGGGALVDIGTHAIDFALYVLGYPEVVEVSGVTRDAFGTDEDYTYIDQWGSSGDGTVDVEDSATALLRCADGQTISLEVAWASNRPPNSDIVVRGTEAGATYNHVDDELELFETSDLGAAHFSDSQVTTRGENGHRAEQRRFVDAVRNDGPAPVTVEEGLAVQRVIDAIYESSETGRAVRLDDPVDQPSAVQVETTD